MKSIALFLGVLVSANTLACVEVDPRPFVPLELIDGNYVEAPGLINKEFLDRVEKSVDRCFALLELGDAYKERKSNLILLVDKDTLEDQECIYTITLEATTSEKLELPKIDVIVMPPKLD